MTAERKLYLTVPNSTYTAVPAAATDAPRIHMMKVIPTLPDELRMILGAANTLGYIFSVSPSQGERNIPSPDHPVEDEEYGAEQP